MPLWLSELIAKTNFFIPHGHCYLWIPSLLWLHVVSDTLIGTAYLGISLILYLLVRRLRLPFSPVFIAFGLFIGLCGLTHFMAVWTVWNPDYWLDGFVKAATAAASVATAIGLVFVRPHVVEVVHAARLSEERRIQLETTNVELQALYDKVKQQDELKSQFFANISHELRTPLTLILGPADRLLADGGLTDAQQRHLQSISRNGKTLLKQVNELLDVAKLDEGKLQPKYVRVDLAPWFRRIASQFEVAAEHRSIHFQVNTPDSLEAEVDPEMIERVFINLLSNAFKFCPDGGTVRARIWQPDGGLHFSIEDSGPGISYEQQELIFQRFRQVDGSATRTFGGTGLGLAIAREFAELHGGRIEVKSRPGEGAAFTVNLPGTAPPGAVVGEAPGSIGGRALATLDTALEEVRREPLQEDHEPEPADSRPPVLVVEDSPEMGNFVADILKGEYQVHRACNGEEGLQKAIAIQPDLVITDVMMPRMSGDVMVEELRKREDMRSVPVLLLTAKADDNLKVRLLEKGAEDYLIKPFLPEELRARASTLVRMKRATDALRREVATSSNDVETLARELGIKHRQLQTVLETVEAAREQAEKASETKRYFLAMISHEVRTPLSTIQMNAQLLGMHREVQQSASFKTQLDRTMRATQQLTTLIEGLLEYTRLESGGLKLRFETVDATSIAKECVELGRLQINSKSLVLAQETVPDDFTPFRTDPRLLRVIINNLLSNAIKFTESGRISLRMGCRGEWRVFEVADTGIGIPKDDLPRIFRPFEQLEPVKRKSIPGAGLGLSLIKEIVEGLGGKIEVESASGKGSIFRVLLPAEPQEAVRADGEEKLNDAL